MRQIIEYFLCAWILTTFKLVSLNGSEALKQENRLDANDKLNIQIPRDSVNRVQREQLLSSLLELRG